MKIRNLLILALTSALTLGAVAAAPKKRKEKKAKTESVSPVSAEQFSYAIGVAQSSSLKQYISQRGVDSTHHALFIDALQGKYTPEQVAQARAEIARLTAITTGVEIAEQNRTHVIPSIDRQATGKDSVKFVVEPLFVQGLVEGMRGAATLTPDSASSIVEKHANYLNDKRKAENAAYLESYKKQKGVKSTASGLLYKVLTKGNGAMPADTAEVEVHYEGRLIDGTVFDSSYKRGQTASFGLKQVIKGWTEGLQLMPVGSTYEFCVPYNLAYGERGSREIPPFATLVFKVELIAIK